jgi:protein O-GlcNAc transferase
MTSPQPTPGAISDRRALALDPAEPLVLERLGRLAGDARWLERALASAPDFVAARINRGALLTRAGGRAGATRMLKRALALDPASDAAWFNRGVAALEPDQARGAYQRTLVLDPAAIDAATNLAQLMAARTPGRAEPLLKRALAVFPAVAPALNALAHLKQSGADNDGAALWFARAEAAAPYDALIASNRLFHLGYDPALSPKALFDHHRRWAGRHASSERTAPAGSPRPAPHPERRLRIGYVSADLVRHPVGFFLLPVLANRNPAALETVCYSGRSEGDAFTERLKAAADDWVETASLDDLGLAQRIRSDRIDILVDLSGHTGAHRLSVFARKPAPLQVTWMGYPATTGLGQIDYLIADAVQVPPADERWYVERILRLEPGYVAYAPPDDAPLVSALPALARGRVTFGSLNNLAKLNPQVFRLWAQVLAAVEGSRLLLAWASLGDARTRQRVQAMATAAGIPSDRLVLRAGGTASDFLARYGEIDVALDPFPYSGGLTTCEALWMGVPVVTWPGQRFASRHAASHLLQAGLDDWIQASSEAYVARAAAAAQDLGRLAELRRTLRARLEASPLLDGAGFSAKLEALYRRIWRDWCA